MGNEEIAVKSLCLWVLLNLSPRHTTTQQDHGDPRRSCPVTIRTVKSNTGLLGFDAAPSRTTEVHFALWSFLRYK